MVVEIWNTKVIVFVRTGAAARGKEGESETGRKGAEREEDKAIRSIIIFLKKIDFLDTVLMGK